jgi:hypothetical protein
MEQAVDLTGFRGKTMWDWLGLLIVPAVILGATGILIYFKKQRGNKRADALIDATQQQGQSENRSHLATENALLRELVET